MLTALTSDFATALANLFAIVTFASALVALTLPKLKMALSSASKLYRRKYKQQLLKRMRLIRQSQFRIRWEIVHGLHIISLIIMYLLSIVVFISFHYLLISIHKYSDQELMFVSIGALALITVIWFGAVLKVFELFRHIDAMMDPDRELVERA
jgi:hypothetical protein